MKKIIYIYLLFQSLTYGQYLTSFKFGMLINNDKIESIETQSNIYLSQLSISYNIFLWPKISYLYYKDESFSSGPILSQQYQTHGLGIGLSFLNPIESNVLLNFNYFPKLYTKFNHTDKLDSYLYNFEFGYQVTNDRIKYGLLFIYQKIVAKELIEPKGNYEFVDLIPSLSISYLTDF